jgi:hypothetical protein
MTTKKQMLKIILKNGENHEIFISDKYTKEQLIKFFASKEKIFLEFKRETYNSRMVDVILNLSKYDLMELDIVGEKK